VVLDGNTAVAETEAAVCEASGLGGTFPADGADLAWRTEQCRLRVNALGSPLSSQTAEGPRGAFAATLGLGLSGVRATSFLSGPDLASCRDLLSSAVGLRLPLVLHLSGRAVGGPGPSLGDGHEALHLAADSGCFVLAAANAQEAVDFALIARRAAELSLHPGVVAMDGARTALALQDVRLPTTGLMEDFLGRPDDEIPCPDEAQRILFGDTRRRLPCRHDPDHPVMWSAMLPAEAGGAATVAAGAFLDPRLRKSLDASFDRFAELTGRAHRPVSAYEVENAELILVAAGSAVETAEAVARHLRKDQRAKVGVLGIRCLSPLPGAEIARLVSGGVRVCVLECSDAPLANDPPLLQAVRVAVDRALENGRFGPETNPGYPVLEGRQRPRFLSVIYGRAGMPLRAADLASLCREAKTLPRTKLYLGIDALPKASAYPKRQVLLDRLRRAYSHVGTLGLRDPGSSPDIRGSGSVTLAILRLSGGEGEGVLAETAALLHLVGRGGMRGRPALFTRAHGEVCVDRLTSGPQDLRDPGDDPPAELVLVLIDRHLPGLRPQTELAPGGTLLLLSPLSDEALWARLPDAARPILKDGRAHLYRLPPPTADVECANDYLLGAACGLLLKRGLLDTNRRRLLGAREEMLRSSVQDVEERLGSFEEGLDAPQEIDTGRLPQSPSQGPEPMGDEAPALVRHLGGSGAYDSLPRFWDHVGVLYRTGETAELSPDPSQALGAVPALSSGFRDLSPLRDHLPILDPTLCTGCGACWAACPDGAIGAAALPPSRLIEAGIRKARADALRPLATRLAAAISDLCRDPRTRGSTAGELIEDAFRGVEARLPLPEDRREAVAQAVRSLVAALGCLPVTAADPFFSEREGTARGSGALLFLALSPDACKGCGICVQTCGAGAWRMARQGSQALRQARSVRTAWESLPETDATIIEGVCPHPGPGPLSLDLLRRSAASSMAGGDGAEPGSGARLAIRLAVASLEALQAPLLAAFAQEVEGARERIAGLIREILADALPSDDLDTLASRLKTVASRQADLSLFLEQTTGAVGSGVDAARLRRLVDLARDLGELGWRLAEGSHGLGRARFGLVLSPGSPAGWAGAFPDNPFAQPVTLDWSGDGAQLAAGLLEGQLRQATQGFVLVRKARLELDHPTEAARLWHDLEGLTWRDLDEAERALCPPLLIVGDSGTLAGRGLSQLVRLLGGNLPVRMLLLADLDLGLGAQFGLDLPLSPTADPAIDLALLAVSQRGAYIAQTSLADPDHLAAGLKGAFAHPGPSLLHVHAPSPAGHGFPADRTLERARMATDARVFPLFRYDPQTEGVFGSRIDLDGNPGRGETWDLPPDGSPLTPAHWALGEGRFADLFSPLADDAPGPTPIAEFLDLPEKERRKCTPFVERSADGSETRRLRIDVRMVKVCEERRQAWRVLQELAGVVTPFTARVRQEAEQRVAAERQTELAALKTDYERKLGELRAQHREELRHHIRERLLGLAGYGDEPGARD